MSTKKDDTKYGVPVAARIDPDIAEKLLKASSTAGISFSKYLAIIIQRAVKNQDKVNALEKEVEEARRDCKEIAATFIREIGEGKNERVKELADVYNRIKYEYDISKGGIKF